MIVWIRERETEKEGKKEREIERFIYSERDTLKRTEKNVTNTKRKKSDNEREEERESVCMKEKQRQKREKETLECLHMFCIFSRKTAYEIYRYYFWGKRVNLCEFV